MSHAVGINSRGRRVHLYSRDDIETLTATRPLSAPMMAAHSTHRRRIPRRTPVRSAHPMRRRSLNSTRPPAVLNRNPTSGRPDTANTARVGLGAVRYKMCGSVAWRDPPGVRRIRLRQRRTHHAEHRERQHDAPHRNPYRCARSRVPACAGFRLSVAPLRHHHHKFLGGREAAELLQPIRNLLPTVVPIRMLAR